MVAVMAGSPGVHLRAAIANCRTVLPNDDWEARHSVNLAGNGECDPGLPVQLPGQGHLRRVAPTSMPSGGERV